MLPCLDPDPVTHFNSDPIQIRNTGIYGIVLLAQSEDPAPFTFYGIRYISTPVLVCYCDRRKKIRY